MLPRNGWSALRRFLEESRHPEDPLAYVGPGIRPSMLAWGVACGFEKIENFAYGVFDFHIFGPSLRGSDDRDDGDG